MKKLIWQMINIVIISAMLVITSQSVFVQAAEASIEEDKNAIVEVQVGLESYAGDFYPIKSASGFIVHNQSNGAFVLTTNHTVVVTNKEKKRVCKKNGLDSSVSGLSTKIRVVVEGDVSTNVEVKASSEQDDFCVLSVGDVLKKKSVIHLDDSEDYSVGDEIYVLGYSSESVKNGTYNIEDVEIHSGSIQNTTAGISSGVYIQHSAVILPEQSGGPLLSKEGYVIGMANSSIINESLDVYYALPIDKIKPILDNYGIAYESKEKDMALDNLTQLYNRCQQEVDSKAYKRNSKEALYNALNKVSELLSQDDYDIDTIISAVTLLESGEKSLVKKTPKIVVIRLILLVLFFILFIRMIIKFIAYSKLKKCITSDENSVEDICEVDKNVRDEESNTPETPFVLDKIMKTQTIDSLFSDNESNETVILEKSDSTVTMKQGLTNVDLNVFDSARAILVEQISGKKVYVSKKEYRIGKNSDNDLPIRKDVISRKHAMIFWKSGDYYIKDLDSANGTYVNGKVLEDTPVKLRSQDLITFADVEMLFIIREV